MILILIQLRIEIERRDVRFKLRSISSDQLLEDTVVVTQAVSPERKLLRCGRVDVARCETAETTVAETSITFVLDQIFEILDPGLSDMIIMMS